MIDYPRCLTYLVPDARIRYTGINPPYQDIEWLDQRPQPTKAECDAIWAEVEYKDNFSQIEFKRQDRYQNETDGIFFDAMRGDGDLAEWIAKCEAIKADLPYPAKPE